MAKTVFISKAQSSGSEYEIQDTTICLCGKLPYFEDLKEAAELYDKDAEKLVDALYQALPGGTFDRVAARMLLRKAGHFAIAWGDSDED